MGIVKKGERMELSSAMKLGVTAPQKDDIELAESTMEALAPHINFTV